MSSGGRAKRRAQHSGSGSQATTIAQRTFLTCLSSLTACVPADRSSSLPAIPFDIRATIYDVRTGNVDSSEPVELTGLVANTTRREGDTSLLVQDPQGGAFSGVELALHHPLPGLEIDIGDLLTVRATIGSRSGRTILVIEDPDGITITGTGSPVPTRVTQVTDWQPLHGVAVEVSELAVLECGQADGRLPTSTGLSIDMIELDRLDGSHPPVDIGPGELVDTVGVISGSANSWHLRPRFIDDLPDPLPGGCPRTVGSALFLATHGRTALDRVVVTGVHQPGDTPRAFIQDPSGGPGRGLELRSSEDFTVMPGDEVQLVGLLSEEGSRTVLWVDGIQPHPDPTTTGPVVTDFNAAIAPSLWQGVLVSLADLELMAATSTGEVATANDIWLSPRLLPVDTPLPTDASGDFTGLFVLPQTDAEALLMPRSEADWSLD